MADEQNQSSGSGKQGFASMDEDKQREIASMGGKASHGGEQTQSAGDDEQTQSSGTGKQGFASMDEDKQREIASMGGKASHKGGSDDESSSEE
jgi:uncharacterized protein